MKLTGSVDTREFIAAARKLKETSSRTCVDFTNGQGLRVASLALKHTHHAERAKLEHDLGAISREVSFKTLTRGKNKGKTRTVRGGYRLAGEDTLAHRILIARRIKTGKFGVSGNLLAEKAQNLIKARVASANFIRAGWIPAIKKLWSVVRKKPAGAGNTREGVNARGIPKGNARPATFSLASKIEVLIENKAMNTHPIPPSGKGNPMKIGKEGLQTAINLTARDMLAELARRLAPDLKAVSAK